MPCRTLLNIALIFVSLLAALLAFGCSSTAPLRQLPGVEPLPLVEGQAAALLCNGAREAATGRIAWLGLDCALEDPDPSPACGALVSQARWDAYKQWFRARYAESGPAGIMDASRLRPGPGPICPE